MQFMLMLIYKPSNHHHIFRGIFKLKSRNIYSITKVGTNDLPIANILRMEHLKQHEVTMV